MAHVASDDQELLRPIPTIYRYLLSPPHPPPSPSLSSFQFAFPPTYKLPTTPSIIHNTMGNIFGTSMLSLKISIFSLTILSAAMILKFSYPLIYELPLLWVSIRSWLTPPFLYLLINFIIITIAASSRFQQPIPTPDPLKIHPQDFVIPPDYDDSIVVKCPVELRPVVGFEVVTNNPAEVEVQPEVSFEAVRNSGENPMALEQHATNVEVRPTRTESMEFTFSMEKPPVSARFGHRKVTKGSSEGKSLKVSKPKRQDTLETTWKMITEGRSMPLTRHLKKSDTWEANHSHSHPGPPEQVKKSETFNDRSNVSSSSLTRSQGSGRLRKEGSGKLRKEPSLGQDDLNRRVEAFINKFNEEMRLQRMESLNRYKEMMSNGAQY